MPTIDLEKDINILRIYLNLRKDVDGTRYKNKILKQRKKYEGYSLLDTLIRDYVFDHYRFEYKGVFRNMDDILSFLKHAVTNSDIDLTNEFQTIGHVIGENIAYVQARNTDNQIEIEAVQA
jgi:hypothetical protein